MSPVDDLLAALSFERIRVELLRVAYGNQAALLDRLDPRLLLGWYAAFLILPWLFFDLYVLGGMLLFMVALAWISDVNRVLLALLALGVVPNFVAFSVVAGVFAVLSHHGYSIGSTVDAIAAGDGIGVMADAGLDAGIALLPFTLKLTIISVASVAVFTTMSPGNLNRALMSFGAPRPITFGIPYAYRMLPVLVREYHDIVRAFRLRSTAPDNPGVFRWRHGRYLLGLAVRAFYPLIFDVAKRARTTVEALETKGFSHSLGNEASRELRLSDLRIRPRDVLFVAGSFAYVAALVATSGYVPAVVRTVLLALPF